MISVVIPYLSNSRCIDKCIDLIKKNTVNECEIVAIADNTDVYGAYNFGVMNSKYDVVALLNDDMFVAPGWDEMFVKYCKENTVVTNYLIECGRVAVNGRNMEKNFGTTPETFDYEGFSQYVDTIDVPEAIYGTIGWYMPVAFYKSTFIEYPNERKYPHDNDTTLFQTILPSKNYTFIKVKSFTYHLQNFSSVK